MSEKVIIGVGTQNPAKIEAVQRFVTHARLIAEIKGYDVSSGVPAMPMSEQETRQGAMNRAKAVLDRDPAITFAIGLEGGVSMIDGEMFLCNWGAAADRSGHLLTAGGAKIALPEPLVSGIQSGEELGNIADAYAHQKNVRSNGGTIGILTEGRVSRSDMFFHILQLIEGMYAHLKRNQIHGR
ncbi:MAG: DUF84 family protein [Sporolactobacillus sp.]